MSLAGAGAMGRVERRGGAGGAAGGFPMPEGLSQRRDHRYNDFIDETGLASDGSTIQGRMMREGYNPSNWSELDAWTYPTAATSSPSGRRTRRTAA